MKKTILFLFIMLAQLTFGQVTLENIYPNVYSGTSKHFSFIQLDSMTYKYALFDPNGSQFTLYNLNHSVYLNVTIPITFVAGSAQYQIAFVTKSLFDCDSTNIEYALSFLGTGSPTSYPKRFYVYRTDGTQLANIDSCCFMNYSDGWKYGPEYNKPIVNTPLGSKLLLRCLDGSARVYSLCGNLPTGIAENINENILGNPFPNPTSDQITIPYSIPESEITGIIKVYDGSGKEVKSFTVDNNFKAINIATTELATGNYYYQLFISGKPTESKKIIKVK